MTRSKLIFAAGALVGAGAIWAGAATAGGGRISLADIDAQLTSIADNQYVPYKTQISGGVCNTAAVGSANPAIVIDGNGSDGTFSVSAVNVRTSGIPFSETAIGVSLSRVVVDGSRFDFVTGPLVVSGEAGSSIDESFNILGAYVGKFGGTAPTDDAVSAGRVPHQLVANSSGANDVRLDLFCRVDTVNLDLVTISVTGWKRASDTISVTYVPGS